MVEILYKVIKFLEEELDMNFYTLTFTFHRLSRDLKSLKVLDHVSMLKRQSLSNRVVEWYSEWLHVRVPAPAISKYWFSQFSLFKIFKENVNIRMINLSVFYFNKTCQHHSSFKIYTGCWNIPTTFRNYDWLLNSQSQNNKQCLK